MTTQEKSLACTVPVVEDASLIKVTTIKRKYVDQMHDVTVKRVRQNRQDYEVIGTTHAFVIVRHKPTSNLEKCHTVQWYDVLMDPNGDFQTERDKAHSEVDQYPQLFED